MNFRVELAADIVGEGDDCHRFFVEISAPEYAPQQIPVTLRCRCENFVEILMLKGIQTVVRFHVQRSRCIHRSRGRDKALGTLWKPQGMSKYEIVHNNT